MRRWPENMKCYFARIPYWLAVVVLIVSSLSSSSLVFAAKDPNQACSPRDADAKCQDYYMSNNIPYYDPDDICTGIPPNNGSSSSSATVDGNDNLEKLLRYFTGKGLSLAAAAGIAGNIKAESGFNPAIIQGGAIAPDDYKPVNSVGFGLAQWTFSDRQTPLVNFAKEKNAKITDLNMQLDFIWYELTTKYKDSTLTGLNGEKTDPARAAYIFHKNYEVSADTEAQVRAVRGAAAVAIYEKYKSTIQDGTGVADIGTASSSQGASYVDASDGSSCSSSNGSGNQNGSSDTSSASSVASDGFVVYDQYDPRWKDTVIIRDTGASTTIGQSGCGPTSMAMIITFLTGQAVDMKKIAQQSNELKLITNGGGYHDMSTKLGPLYGLKSVKIALNVAKISDALKRGSAIHIVGQGASPFTGSGHFIMLRGITSTGNWLVGDSNDGVGKTNSANLNGFNPQFILGYATDAYEVSK